MKPLIPSTPILMPEGATSFAIRWFSYNKKFEGTCLLSGFWYKATAATLEEVCDELQKSILCGRSVSVASTVPKGSAKPLPTGKTLAEQEAELNELLSGL